jgi:mRNA interferase MazF
MPTFSIGDVVRVPFPYTDRATRQHRPALVVSNGGLGEAEKLLIVAMITAAENRPWVDDLPIPDHKAVGLPVPSVIRPCKLATIEAAHTERIGHIGSTLAAEVGWILAGYFGLSRTGKSA